MIEVTPGESEHYRSLDSAVSCLHQARNRAMSMETRAIRTTTRTDLVKVLKSVDKALELVDEVRSELFQLPKNETLSRAIALLYDDAFGLLRKTGAEGWLVLHTYSDDDGLDPDLWFVESEDEFRSTVAKSPPEEGEIYRLFRVVPDDRDCDLMMTIQDPGRPPQFGESDVVAFEELDDRQTAFLEGAEWRDLGESDRIAFIPPEVRDLSDAALREYRRGYSFGEPTMWERLGQDWENFEGPKDHAAMFRMGWVDGYVALDLPRSTTGLTPSLLRAYEAGKLLGELHRVMGKEPAAEDGFALTFAMWGMSTDRAAIVALTSTAAERASEFELHVRATGSCNTRNECCAVLEVVGSPDDPLHSALEIIRPLAEARGRLDLTCHAWRWYRRPSSEELLGEMMRWGSFGFAASAERFLSRSEVRDERGMDLAYWLEWCGWLDEEE